LPVRVALSFNPSHLEFVGAVTLGETRARQQRYHGGDVSKVVPIVLHGDAAFAGQGVVFETMQMMKLQGYSVGGTIHLVANNQVGFTTNPFDARSSVYCTDVAKVVGAPVFHVNADDIHAVHNVAAVCAEYRLKFGKDVVVDLVCFRRHGHNEADEPRFTQPVLYRAIESKKAPYEAYLSTLASAYASEGFTEAGLKAEYEALRASMNVVFDKVRQAHTPISPMPRQRGNAALKASLPSSAEADMLAPVNTGVEASRLRAVGTALSSVPESFTANSKLSRIILGERKEMLEARKRIDWGFGELLAYGTLLQEGYSIRLAGQDARRGTFSHRHGTLVDANSGSFHTSLTAVASNDARIEIIDSLLSEAGAMGFDYGFSVQHDKALALWEGQFGDFANGAQVIIDQFIAAGESKWCQTTGLVLLLPHGYEGQGPEHSSARMERFLALYAEGNMQVCYFTNVAQLFHALRRQMVRPFRKPLIIMTPKSFVRSPRASASFEDLENGRMHEILDDARFASEQDAAKVKKVVLCTGKVALDIFDTLDKEEHAARAKEVAVVRIEQIAPFHQKGVESLLKRYAKATELVWCQEEPANMGAWTFLWPKLQAALRAAGHKGDVAYVGRSERASPAVGLEKQHFLEQEKILTHAVAGKGPLRV
ncbi:MAG: 2-oxoglutarate dehydrogenase E1 component, partial [Silvanigrellales bacterium]|nr:2-oxoglutarate dehydrogenase E1 component [Silvanigrellales bacterium]